MKTVTIELNTLGFFKENGTLAIFIPHLRRGMTDLQLGSRQDVGFRIFGIFHLAILSHAIVVGG